METSYAEVRSYWVKPDCESMLPVFDSARDSPTRERMSALVILGNGRMSELPSAMPRGEALARFEQHWIDPQHEARCQELTQRVEDVFRAHADTDISRPYRGDIWKAEQAQDPALTEVLVKYDTRSI